MDSRKAPALIALGGAVLAVALFLVLKDDTADEDTTLPPAAKSEKFEVPVVEVEDGKPVGGVRELEFPSGAEARFEVVADATDELHLHGYDIYADLKPGRPTDVAFAATIEGVFELESHATGELFAEISVVPE